VVAHFWANWADQCTQIDQVLIELGKLHTNIKLVKVTSILPAVSEGAWLEFILLSIEVGILMRSWSTHARTRTRTTTTQVEAEKHVELSQKHGIVAVPTVLLFNHGAMVDRVDGANVPLLAKLAEKLSKSRPAAPSAKPAAAAVSTDSGKALEIRLKELVNAAPVMLFMKGSPEVSYPSHF
jgi:thioredoxin-like negative regulator of GroEL